MKFHAEARELFNMEYETLSGQMKVEERLVAAAKKITQGDRSAEG